MCPPLEVMHRGAPQSPSGHRRRPVRKGVCPPARTARIITSQLRGLTHVQGLSVQSVGWLGVIRSSSEDPCPITVPLLLR